MKFGKYFKLHIIFFSFLFFICTSLFADVIFPQKRVLIIGDTDLESESISAAIEGIKYVLTSDILVSYQFMELDDVEKDHAYILFYNRIREYIDNREFDAIVAIGDDSYNFCLTYRNVLFFRTPIVYLGVQNYDLVLKGQSDELITGIQEIIHFVRNINLAKGLFPNAKQIYLITDNTYAGTSGSLVFNSLNDNYPDNSFVELNTEELSLSGVSHKLRNASSDDIVLYLSGKGLARSRKDRIDFILTCCAEKNIPVFTCSYGNFGTGILGGYVNSYKDMGYEAGKRILNIFRNNDSSEVTERIASILRKQKSENEINPNRYAKYWFDYSVMKKYRIPKSKLDQDTIYFQSENFFTKRQIGWIVFAIVLLIFFIANIVFFIIHISKRRKLRELFEEHRRMLHAVMDQSETVYWECDFSESNFFEKFEPTVEETLSSDDYEELEELETVEDGTPLGKVATSDVEEIPMVESAEYLERLNNTNDVVQGWIYSGVIQREYREQFEQLLRDFKNGKTKKSIEIDIPIGIEDIRNNVQTERWKHIVYRAVKVENEKVLKAICSATDITSQKRAEKEYEGIMKYQCIVQKNYPAYSRLNLTKNLVLERYVNIERLESTVTGNSAKTELEFIKNMITTNNQNKGFAALLDREELIIEFKNGARQKSCDFCYKLPSGAIHWYSLCIELAFNPSSGDIEAYCYLKDITSQTIANVTKDSVLKEDVEYIFWLNTLTGMCQFINKADSVNWIKENDSIEYAKMLDTFLKKKVSDPDKEEVKLLFDVDRIKKELEDKQEIRFTYHARKDDGAIEIKQEKIYYLEPGTNILVFVSTDITAITLMENQQNEKLAKAIKEAERANYAKSEFLSRMSHDLRTPMNGIIGISELALRELNEPEKIERDIEKIQSSSSYMLGLLNDILDMSKIESGKLEIRKVKASFGEMLENVITLAHVMCDKNGIIFYCNRKPNEYKDLIVNVDRLHLQQIVMNLISNASKFTPRGGNIDLLISADELPNNILHVKTVIKDTGAGMTKEFQKIMYEAFTQDSNSVNKVGTGLGLAIVHNLVRLMGGTINCVSAPQEGTEFTFVMDVEKIVEENSEVSTTDGGNKKDVNALSLSGKRVLLVEDNELNQEIASRLLIDEGLQVEIANNGLEALNTFTEKEENYYDLVLMDVMMPVMDGLECTRLMRKIERGDAKNIPIIAMTANAFTEDIERCAQAGMNTHIAKPIETDKMMQTIKEYIGY